MISSNKQQKSAFLISAPTFRPQIVPASRFPPSPVPSSPAPLSPSIVEYWLNVIQKHHLEIIFGDPSKKLYDQKLFVCFSAGKKNETISQDETNWSFQGLTNRRNVLDEDYKVLSCFADQFAFCSWPLPTLSFIFCHHSNLPQLLLGLHGLRFIMTVHREMHERCVSHKILSVA